MRDGFWLLVRAFHQAHACAEPHHASQILLGSIERRLQDDAHLAIPEAPQRLEDVERHLRVLRSFHVEADEEAVRFGLVEYAPQVVDAAGAVDLKPELRELQREVASYARVDDFVDDLEVFARGHVGLSKAAETLSEMI